jgi:hypothetical protein
VHPNLKMQVGGDDWGANGSSSGSSANKVADDDDWGLLSPLLQPPQSHAYKPTNVDFDFDFGDHEDRLLPTMGMKTIYYAYSVNPWTLS